MLALPQAGRTTILYRWKLGQVLETTPTIGFNVETIEYKNANLTFWDIGGGDKIRPLWRHYYSGTHGVIFVIDSSEPEYISDVRGELLKLLSEEDLIYAPVLILANKQDKPGAMSGMEIKQKLQLPSWTSHRWYLVETCATIPVSEDDTGTENDHYHYGLHEGIEWLFQKMLTNPYRNINPSLSQRVSNTTNDNIV